MDKQNSKKAQQLGESYGAATNRLRKMVLFRLLKRFGLDVCHQCQQKIVLIEELSIEHKTPWLDSADPVKLFFDLDNIGFSHLLCNVGAARKPFKGTIQGKSFETEQEYLDARHSLRASTERKWYARAGKENRHRRYIETGR